MKKRGQAFLISSIVIIMVLVAFVTIANFSKKTTFSTFPFVAEEIQIESEKVMDYDLINQENKIENFTEVVSNYVDEDTRIYFITEENNIIKCYNWTGSSKTFLNSNDCQTGSDPINVTIDNTVHKFPLTQGKHFYFIMIKEIKGEKYVYTNA